MSESDILLSRHVINLPLPLSLSLSLSAAELKATCRVVTQHVTLARYHTVLQSNGVSVYVCMCVCVCLRTPTVNVCTTPA